MVRNRRPIVIMCRSLFPHNADGCSSKYGIVKWNVIIILCTFLCTHNADGGNSKYRIVKQTCT